ncbi:hypothetical protein NHQ30_008175 [Ciborinia camelliae]|nr:hypothetical protein NHQ30_008175 [Ciborinia camelliae]
MNPFQNQGYQGGSGWAGGSWNPAQQGYLQQNNWRTQQPQQPQQQQQQQQPQIPAPQYNPQPAPELFCCDMCQRCPLPAQQTVHAYTTRLAFFVNHVLHPRIATFAQPSNRPLHRGFFEMVPLSTVVPITGAHGGHGQGGHAQQSQQHGLQQQVSQQQASNHGFQQQPPSGPANTHYTAASGSFPNNFHAGFGQQGYNQQGGYQSVVPYSQNNNQQQHAHTNGPPANQPPQPIQGPIMFGGSSYSINPTIPIPLPHFMRPRFQLNVKFRFERYRLDPPAQTFPYGNPNQAIGPYQSTTPYTFSAPTTPTTPTPRAKENMELIWYYWPVQLEIPLWARGQNTETSAPDIADQLIREGMQMINGERWGFMEDGEDREGLWHKRRSYKVLECPVHGMLWKVTVFVRRGY